MSNKIKITKKYLVRCYINKRLSVSQIASSLKCSEQKINYWIKKHNISKRSISESVYLRKNKGKDPFKLRKPTSLNDFFMFGVGLGLFWGEGNKKNVNSLRLGNTDPDLIRYYLFFLRKFFSIERSALRFGLQIFSDISEEAALSFWSKKVHARTSQFYKTTITRSKKLGTYTNKNKYGVLTVYFNNTKMRDIILGAIEYMARQNNIADVAQLVEHVHGGSKSLPTSFAKMK